MTIIESKTQHLAGAIGLIGLEDTTLVTAAPSLYLLDWIHPT
ncbi:MULTISPECIES: hypothetical protein [unclassified Thermosynechococcus]|nr:MULTISPECIES: hypothetical protein [unclassified Thermosynechococcus]MDR5639469.1 hypothetical protein [Thermosynechococcus sp. PP42]MDR7898558.1 hypothetical protein [Thermosynechococcus sp. JY1332]MDR7905962.1 hypothetical protein [Thermosynechococcus sp. JY1334]MDR7921857.1 hypothetical protein [Thermosynechococcus sp. HY213]MDR7993781.1 hypothetical protein [Thermosynechococcus sp. TG252]